MTSKERLLTVLRHGTPDRVPISTYELVGYNENAWENQQPAYKPLMDYIREKTDCMYMLGVPVETAGVPYGFDVRDKTHIKQWTDGGSTFTRNVIMTPKGDISSLCRIDKEINTVWTLEHLIKDDDDMERLLSMSHSTGLIDASGLIAESEKLGDRGILLIDISDPLGDAAGLFEFGEFTIRASTDRRNFTMLLDSIFEYKMYLLEEMLKQGVGPLFRIIGPEYATPPYLGTDLFHEYICKYDSRMIRLIHDYGQYARLHSHGRVRDILPHVLEMEADAVDPVEASHSGDIELWEAKKILGNKVCIIGNIQLRDLETLSPGEMRKITIKCMEEAKEGGNFVIMPTACPINENLSPATEENYKVFIDTALEYGEY